MWHKLDRCQAGHSAAWKSLSSPDYVVGIILCFPWEQEREGRVSQEQTYSAVSWYRCEADAEHERKEDLAEGLAALLAVPKSKW